MRSSKSILVKEKAYWILRDQHKLLTCPKVHQKKQTHIEFKHQLLFAKDSTRIILLQVNKSSIQLHFKSDSFPSSVQ